MRAASLLLTASLAALLTSGCSAPHSEPMKDHGSAVGSVSGVAREGGEGPYVSGALETFVLQFEGAAPEVLWSASSGALNSSGTRATWRLPAPGTATLSAVIKDASGEEKTLSWNFQVVSADDNLASARQALLSAPIPVGDGGTAPADLTGSSCHLAYDSTNKVHLAYRNDTHPALWYGVWNGTSWSIELVDGMGFNTGGMVIERFAMVLDASNNPHFAYQFVSQQTNVHQQYYATKSGGTWTRERVDSAYAPRYETLSLALNPAQSAQPTIVYSTFVSSIGARTVVARRTAPGTWSETRLNFSSSTGSQLLKGDVLFDAAGVLYVPHNNFLGAWDGTTASHLALGLSLDSAYTNMVWAEPGTILINNATSLSRIVLGSPISASTETISTLEHANYGSIRNALAWKSKPYVLHVHGSNLELITPNAQNYFTYTQLGTASTQAIPAVAVNSAGTVSLCYRGPNGQILFQ